MHSMQLDTTGFICSTLIHRVLVLMGMWSVMAARKLLGDISEIQSMLWQRLNGFTAFSEFCRNVKSWDRLKLKKTQKPQQQQQQQQNLQTKKHLEICYILLNSGNEIES